MLQIFTLTDVLLVVKVNRYPKSGTGVVVLKLVHGDESMRFSSIYNLICIEYSVLYGFLICMNTDGQVKLLLKVFIDNSRDKKNYHVMHSCPNNLY
jgi:hypothetical protein